MVVCIVMQRLEFTPTFQKKQGMENELRLHGAFFSKTTF
jgi:hypothetical protein